MGQNIMGVELNLDQEYIKGAVEDIVKAGIVSALGDPAAIVKTALDKTINQRVDRDGKPTRDSWNTKPYLEWLADQVVEKTVRECLQEYVEQNKEVFRQEILRQLSSKTFKNNLAAAYLDCILSSTKSEWKMPISVEFQKPKEY